MFDGIRIQAIELCLCLYLFCVSGGLNGSVKRFGGRLGTGAKTKSCCRQNVYECIFLPPQQAALKQKEVELKAATDESLRLKGNLAKMRQEFENLKKGQPGPRAGPRVGVPRPRGAAPVCGRDCL
jgi:hypothetical protein